MAEFEDKLEEYTKEMRDRSHELARIIQGHTAELAVMETVANNTSDLAKAVWGDPKSGTDTGLRGVVQMLAQQLRDTELARSMDRRREEEQQREILARLDQQSRQITEHGQKLTVRVERGKGALGLIREIGQVITILSTAAALIALIIHHG
jgi:hypothetical protein